MCHVVALLTTATVVKIEQWSRRSLSPTQHPLRAAAVPRASISRVTVRTADPDRFYPLTAPEATAPSARVSPTLTSSPDCCVEPLIFGHHVSALLLARTRRGVTVRIWRVNVAVAPEYLTIGLVSDKRDRAGRSVSLPVWLVSRLASSSNGFDVATCPAEARDYRRHRARRRAVLP